MRRSDYVISFTHTEKLRERKISADDIEEAIRHGAIVEDYPDDPRGPSCLILGRSGGRPLHVVCGRLQGKRILIITAYGPDQGMGVGLAYAQEVRALWSRPVTSVGVQLSNGP